jgi:hypothetical protein
VQTTNTRIEQRAAIIHLTLPPFSSRSEWKHLLMSDVPMRLFNLLKLHYEIIVGDINRLLFVLFIVVSFKPSSLLLCLFFACNQIHIKLFAVCGKSQSTRKPQPKGR